MPTLPTYTKCAELGCKETRGKYNSFCAIHGGVKKISVERKQLDSMYQTPFWKAKRKTELSKHPLCASCLCKGRVSPANHVDHVFPWSVIGQEAFMRNLFQSLCNECHSYKTGQEQKGHIIHYLDGQETLYTLQDYSRKVGESLET